MECLELLKIGFLMRIIENSIQTTEFFLNYLEIRRGKESESELGAENPVFARLRPCFHHDQ